MGNIDASNAKVIETYVDEATGETVTTQRDAHDVNATKTEIRRHATPTPIKSEVEKLEDALVAKGVIAREDIKTTKLVR